MSFWGYRKYVPYFKWKKARLRKAPEAQGFGLGFLAESVGLRGSGNRKWDWCFGVVEVLGFGALG